MTSQLKAVPDLENPESASQTIAESKDGEDTDVREGIFTDSPDDLEKNVGGQERNSDKLNWDGPDDPDNPMNWPGYKKKMQIVCVAMLTLVANLSTTMFAPGASQLMSDFKVSSEVVISLTVSIYLLGFGLGPLLLAPLSELYGRLPVYAVSGTLYIAFTIGCAFATNIGMLIAFRLLVGAAGSAPLAIFGGTLADVVEKQDRGRWMALFVLGLLMGPVIGPVAGGFIAQSVGWRWVFRVLLIACGVTAILCVAFLRETYAPVILRHRAVNRRKNQAGPSDADPSRDIGAMGQLGRNITRPMKLLLFSPIVLFLSLYVAFAFGLMFLLMTSFSQVFSEQYGWSVGISGLGYLGLGVGMFVAVAVQGKVGEDIMKSRAAKRGGQSKPEDRLPLMAWTAPFFPMGLVWYGWSVDKQTHWIVPILGTVLVGVGVSFVIMPPMIYLIDVFGPEAGASALAANTVLRSVAGAFLPLAGPPMYQKLHLGWGNTLLAFLGVAFIPVPWVLTIYGERIRLSRKVNL